MARVTMHMPLKPAQAGEDRDSIDVHAVDADTEPVQDDDGASSAPSKLAQRPVKTATVSMRAPMKLAERPVEMVRVSMHTPKGAASRLRQNDRASVPCE